MNKFIKIGKYTTLVFDIEKWGIGLLIDFYYRIFVVKILCFAIDIDWNK